MKSDWNNKTLLITGGAGFVGGNLTKKLLAEGVKRIFIVDNLLSAEPENIPDSNRIVFRNGSIADDRILDTLTDDFDYIFHLATYHGNQSSIHDPEADHENNLITTLKLFNRIKEYKKIKKVVYSSAGCAVADKTFGNACATTEDGPVSIEMDSPYSISKIVGEFYSVYFYNQYGLPAVRARFQNVYGPGEILGAGQWRGTPATVWRNVIPTFIYKALKKGALPLENKGVATRDFIYVDDIVNGLILCALKGQAGDVYNLASGVETSIKSLAEIINRSTGNPSPPAYLPGRAWDRSGKRFGSTEKAKLKLGFQTVTALEDGILKTLEWTESNINLIERAIKKHQRFLKVA